MPKIVEDMNASLEDKIFTYQCILKVVIHELNDNTSQYNTGKREAYVRVLHELDKIMDKEGI